MERLSINENIEPRVIGDFPQTVSVNSEESLVDKIFIIASALRCRTLPCTLKKIDKNRDLLTRPLIAHLKENGYEEDDSGNLFKLIDTKDGIQKVAIIMRLPVGSVAPWGVAFFPSGSGYEEAEKDLRVAVDGAYDKVIALSKSIFIQVDFLKEQLKIPALALHDSVIHYEDAIDFVRLNRPLAKEIVGNFGILHPVMFS